MTIHKDYMPSEDATVVKRLSDAGTVILGKLQLTESAYADDHPNVTPPRNPWNAERGRALRLEHFHYWCG
jgi:amidase